APIPWRSPTRRRAACTDGATPLPLRATAGRGIVSARRNKPGRGPEAPRGRGTRMRNPAHIVALALALGLAGPAAAEPLKIRIGWATMPGHLIPVLYSKCEILK